MSIEKLAEQIPDFANDIKLSLSSVMRQTELTQQQLWGCALACAVTCRNETVIAEITEEAITKLSPEALQAAKGAAAVMAMNNIYYRFQHLVENDKYQSIPARLRMNVIRSHGMPTADFELWCLATSSITGCGMCVKSHERLLKEQGMDEGTIVAAVRIAAVLNAVATLVVSK